MSVLACSRSYCPNIMCDMYHPKYGYICDTCLTELQATQPDSLREFLETPPARTVIESKNWYDEFHNRWDD